MSSFYQLLLNRTLNLNKMQKVYFVNIDNDIPTINMEVFDDLLSILEDDFYDLLKNFINDTPAQLTLLDSAIDQADFKHIFSIGHAQTGATGNIGLSKFFHLCKELCLQAKEENIKECSELSVALHQNYEECKALLTEKINNPS